MGKLLLRTFDLLFTLNAVSTFGHGPCDTQSSNMFRNSDPEGAEEGLGSRAERRWVEADDVD